MYLKKRRDFSAVPCRCHEEQCLGFEVLNSFIPVKLHTCINVPYEKSCIFIRRHIILAYLMTFSVTYYVGLIDKSGSRFSWLGKHLYEWKCSSPNLKYYTDICSEELRKMAKNDNMSPCGTLRKWSRAISTWPRHFFKLLANLLHTVR